MGSDLFGSEGISQVIQLAVAPVFLLASISAALNVLSLRMGRIIDRGRRLNSMNEGEEGLTATDIDYEQRLLAERARLTHRAIAMCTLSALMVSLVIALLFVDALFDLHIAWIIACVFILALSVLIVALLTFLRETGLGTNTFRFGPYVMGQKLRDMRKFERD
jgi:hypothetical protein